jgi:hypothetical protein
MYSYEKRYSLLLRLLFVAFSIAQPIRFLIITQRHPSSPKTNTNTNIVSTEIAKWWFPENFKEKENHYVWFF